MCACLSALERHEAALEFAKQALENAVGKNKAICMYNMGVQMEFIGQFKQAIKYYTEAKDTTEDETFRQVVVRSIGEVNQKLQRKLKIYDSRLANRFSSLQKSP